MNRLERSARERLGRLEARRERRVIEPPRGIDFSSNDYLGLRTHPHVVRAALAATKEYGLGSGGARLLRGDTPAHRRLERRFADWREAEDALFFPSGFQANFGVLQTLAPTGWTILSDSCNHASIVEGCRAANGHAIVIPHNDVAAFAGQVRNPRTIIVTESVFSMSGEHGPIAELSKICVETGAALIVDEAHAVGLFPPLGEATVRIHPCGKALGAAGAIVTGSHAVIDLLRSRCRSFLFTTSPPPALAAGILAALEILVAEPERPQRALELARRFHPDAKSCIVSLPCRNNGHAIESQDKLAELGFDVRAVRPPTVVRACLRVSIHSDRTEQEVDDLRAALQSMGLLG